MRSAHKGLTISDLQRTHWLKHLLAACEEVGVSEEFMKVFVPHIEFYTKMVQEDSWGRIQQGFA